MKALEFSFPRDTCILKRAGLKTALLTTLSWINKQSKMPIGTETTICEASASIKS